MDIKNLDYKSKKKIVVTTISVIAVILVLCIITTAVVGIFNAVSDGGVTFSGGLSEDKLTSTVASKETSLYGSLILVNQIDGNSHEYTFPENNDHLENFYNYKNNNGGGSYDLNGSEVFLHKEAVASAHKMLCALSSKGISDMKLLVASTYRSYDDQAGLGSTISAGYSDHHTGYTFSLRRGSTPLSPDDYNWLHENAEDYGFIMRYPEDKAPATGVSEYTNCLRYVGVAHANLMNQKGLCLEEYIEYLKENADKSPVGVKCSNGNEYFIYYYKFQGKQINIKIPLDSERYPFEVSGTNDGGVVVTVRVK